MGLLPDRLDDLGVEKLVVQAGRDIRVEAELLARRSKGRLSALREISLPVHARRRPRAKFPQYVKARGVF